MSDHPPTEPTPIDPALYRGLTERRHSRAGVLRAAGLGAALVGLPGALAACGSSGSAKTSSTSGGKASASTVGSKQWWAGQSKHGHFVFANWPLYIDTDHGKHPSLAQFQKQTGIKVDYKEPIQDNSSFYAKVAPSLRAGQGTGYDIIVITNGWYLTELIDNGWLIPLDHSKLPNFQQYASSIVKNPAYDPGNKYTVAWQSGFTGIGYNPKLTGRKITSINDLFDPKFKGHVGMMSDTTEVGSVALLKMGIDPTKSTHSDWQKAADILKKQRSDGLVRQYYDQSYIKALESGDVWITQAWSGDIFQAKASGHKDLEFVVPREGVMKWTDNMMIPMHAQNPVDAISWMNFYYQPKIAAEVADWVNYITPVPAAKQVIAKQLDDPAVANSPLVFPTPAMNKKAYDYYVYKNYADYQAWQNIFNPIVQS